MRNRTNILILVISIILFTILFHNQALGLNVLIFEAFITGWLFFTKQFKFFGKNQIICALGLIITMLYTVFIYSDFAFIINFLMLFMFVGSIMYPDAKSLVTTLRLSVSNLSRSQRNLIKELTSSEHKKNKFIIYLWRFRIFIIPVLIIILFLIFYSHSNPIFNRLLQNIGLFFNNYLSFIFNNIDAGILITIFFGGIISIYIVYRSSDPYIIESDKSSSNFLTRIRNNYRRSFKFNALRNELRAAIFLLFILNAILIILNVIDIYWVWFNFEWNGLTLKQFVHEGTYLLILSILTSIVVVLYFFRNNLNFYSNNRLLKFLCYIWLAQNAILAISVAIRNYWYIYYFSLAYKRIGVIIFLILCLYGIYTVLIKVKYKKSDFWLLNSNISGLLIVLVICSVFNWDNIIAKYNFEKSKRSFVHFNFLASLSDKSLPYLDKPLAELTMIDSLQKEKFPAEKTYYMTSGEYYQRILERKQSFKLKWESKSILSWNLPEYLAYRKLYHSSHK
ncbi:MAG: DUF4173 domain-containing protein [Bacteroidales bacterium]